MHKISVAVAVATVALFSGQASAQTEFEPELVNLIIESRHQKPGSQATSSERAAAIDELESIYAITELPRAKELAGMARIRAQIELSSRALLFQAFANDYLRSNPASEQEIFNLYEEEFTANPPMEFKARHILVESQGAAAGLIEQLNAGADFASLAQTHSTGPSGPSGGDLGWFTSGQMVPEFSNAVALLEDGGFSQEAVQTQFGWHVILREESRASTPPPLDNVRDVLKQRIEQEKFQKFMESVRDQPAG